MANLNQGTSSDTKTIVAALLLVLLFPVGFILMWAWTDWPKWVKLLISLPIIIVATFFVILAITIATNPAGQVRKADCVNQCGGNAQDTACINACMQKLPNPSPSSSN